MHPQTAATSPPADVTDCDKCGTPTADADIERIHYGTWLCRDCLSEHTDGGNGCPECLAELLEAAE
jgi:ribosomal protein L37AE/L43A